MRFKQERAREIAEAATESLFVNGNGDKAERLVLVSGKSDLGGWSRAPVADIILAAMNEALEEQEDKAHYNKCWVDEAAKEIKRYREALEETAEEIDNTVLQQVSNRGLAPGYVRDLVLAAVNEALAEQEGRIATEVCNATLPLHREVAICRAALDEIEKIAQEGASTYNPWSDTANRCRAIIARTREGGGK